MEQYKYDFSVVMAIYNTEAYLREAIESLVQQTVGFKRIQLILVDDGSKDNSGSICDEYGKKYPGNVVVVHKENGGVASARNTGLTYAEGRYLNFMDSDDKFAKNTFEKVYRFFSCHEDETDICTVPIYFFEANRGPHWQNGKFDKGTRIIDLREEYEARLVSVSASFIVSSLKNRIVFDSNLVCGEDIKVILSILVDKMTMGVVADGRYLYRRRLGENPSLIQSSRKKKGWYEEYFTYLIDWCIEFYQKRYGYIPGFVQYELLSDLQWRFSENYENDMRNVFEGDQELIDRYYKRLLSYLQIFDDKYIVNLQMLKEEHKYYMLQLKYGMPADLKMEGKDAGLWFHDRCAAKISKMNTELEFLELDKKSRKWVIEGNHTVFGSDTGSVSPYIIVNGKAVSCETIDRDNKHTMSLGTKISDTVGFRAEIPEGTDVLNIEPAVKLNGVMIRRKSISFGEFFPVSAVYKNAYAFIGKWMATFENGCLRIAPKPSGMKSTVREVNLLCEIWDKDLLGGRKAVAGRLFYHMVIPFKHRRLWIISDRIMKADDNGEALFRYILKKKPPKTDVIFAISKNSKDYARISKLGRCVDAMSYRHKLLHLISDMVISSHADGTTHNPFIGYHDALRDLLTHQKYVFLQHGIIMDNLSGWLNRYRQNIRGFVTSTIPEYNSIVGNKDYHYAEEHIWLTGLPRYDRLYYDEKKIITIMPTWRRYLMEYSDPKTGIFVLRSGFEEQPYYQFYNALINSERLLSGISEYGYKLCFFPHPNIQPYINRFPRDPRVDFVPFDTPYRKVFAESNLVVTDYSSVSIDFAYLRKPIIYCQFDRDAFFDGRHPRTKGYFDYEENGFGEVSFDLEHTIDLILEYVSNDCALKKMYRDRIDSFFAYNDCNNSQRVLEKILALEGNH